MQAGHAASAPGAKATAAPQPRPPPWATTEEAEKRCRALKAAIQAAEQEGGDEQLLGPMREELAKPEKKATERRPLIDQLEGCRAYLARARTRRDKLLKELEEKKQVYDELEKDIGAHEDKLEALAQEALKEMSWPAGVSTAEAIAEMATKIQELVEIAEKQAAADSERKSPPAKRTKTEASAQPAAEDTASPIAVTLRRTRWRRRPRSRSRSARRNSVA